MVNSIYNFDFELFDLDQPVKTDKCYEIKPKNLLYLQLNNVLIKSSGENSMDVFLDEDSKNFMLKFDEECIQKIVNNSSEWFGREMSKDDVENSFIPSLKFKSTYIQPFMKLYLNSIQIFDQNKNNIDFDKLNPNETIRTVLKCDNIQCWRTKMNCHWSIIQIQQNINYNIEESYMFNDNIGLP